MSGDRQYSAFISYARVDEDIARWLTRYLENLWVASPKLTRPFNRVFRDADEMGASNSLGDTLKLRLDQSERLIILLSEASLRSRWVQEEIAHFRERHPSRPVFAIVVDEHGLKGRSLTAWVEGVLGELAPTHPLLHGPEPVAPDIASEGRQVAARRLAAGMLNVSYDTLAQRRLRASLAFGGAIALAFTIIGVSAYFGQPALAAYQAMQTQRTLEAEFVSQLDELAYNGTEAARLIACCADLVEQAPEATRNRIYDLVRHEGLLRGPVPSEEPSLPSFTILQPLGANRFVAAGGDGFVVMGPDGPVLGGQGNIIAVGWDAQSNRLFTVSPGFNFRGASILSYDLAGAARGIPVAAQGTFDISDESVRVLAASGPYAYFVNTVDWRVARVDMRDGALRTGSAGRPTRAEATPDGRIVRLGFGEAEETLLVDMGDGRSAPDISGTITSLGIVSYGVDSIFRFDTWTWSNIVDRGDGALDGYEGLIPIINSSIDGVATTGLTQVRCSPGAPVCERHTVFTTPYNIDGGGASLSPDHRLAIVQNSAFDIATKARIEAVAGTMLLSWRDGREILGLFPRREPLLWDMSPDLNVAPSQMRRRICETTLRESATRTIGARQFHCAN